MIALVLSCSLPAHPLLKRRCLADPDALERLAEEASRSRPPAQELCDRFSMILDDLRMGGAWKRTCRERLKRTEEMLCAYIAPELRRDLVFLDIGASDGVTTVEAVRALRQAFGKDVEAYLADLNLWLLRYRRGPVVEYRAKNGEPIMVRLGPFGVRLAKPRRGTPPTGNPLVKFYLRRQRFRDAMGLDRPISLSNPLSRGEPGLKTIEFDCLRREESLVGRISAIRASNTLNLGYFEPRQIRQAIGHCHTYLREGGCLVVSQNGDGPQGATENGSVWIKEAERFRRVEDFGWGSEVRAIVDAWPNAAGEMSAV